MDTEITRASDADRERYLSHLREMYAQGRVTEDEFPKMTDRILSARTYAVMDSILDGLPPLPGSRKTPDRAHPRYFVPRLLGSFTASLAIAILPSNVHGTSSVILASCLLVGILGAVASFFALMGMLMCWADSLDS